MMSNESVLSRPRPDGTHRVLVVDDDPEVAEAVTGLLSSRDREVRTVHSGREALGVFEGFGPDMVVLDLGMPDLDGYATAVRLRKLPSGPSAVIVALTGNGTDDHRRRSAAAGFDHHLVKPLNGTTLTTLMTLVDNLGKPDQDQPGADGC